MTTRAHHLAWDKPHEVWKMGLWLGFAWRAERGDRFYRISPSSPVQWDYGVDVRDGRGFRKLGTTDTEAKAKEAVIEHAKGSADGE